MDTFKTQNQSAKFIGITVPTLKKYRRLGHFNPVEMPGGAVLYPVHELQDFKEKYGSDIRQGRTLVATAYH